MNKPVAPRTQDSAGAAVHANTGTRTATNLARLRRLRQYSR